MYLVNRARPQSHRRISRCFHTLSPVFKQLQSESGGLDSPSTQHNGTEVDEIPEPVLSPDPRPVGKVFAPWSSNISELHTIMREHLKVPPLGGLVPPGYHQVSHVRLEPEWHLCEDGAQLKYSPGSEYKCRVWSGGSMDFKLPFMPRIQEPLTADERFESCRTLRNGDDDTGRAWVHIVQDFISSSRRNIPAAFETSEDDKSGFLISEKKGLLFFKEIPDSLKSKQDARSTQPVPGNSIRQLTMMPTPAMLFRFSALTFNSHAIHLDREFAKSVYGIPDLLVHGPLTSVFMLEMLRTTFAELSHDNKADYFIKNFEYRNHKPLWVNEEITIGCKRIITDRIAPRFQLSDGERKRQFQREMWQVWISRGTGDSETLAVEGTATVSVAPHQISPLKEWRTLNLM